MRYMKREDGPAGGLDPLLLRLIHDLREPLRKANIRTQMLAQGRDSFTTEAQTHVRAIQDAIRHADLLLSRISQYCASGVDLPEDAIQAGVIVKGALAKLGDRRGECIVDIELAGLKDVPVPQSIERVFYELLDNAFKFRTKAGTISIRGEAVDGVCRFTVADDGIGFDPKFSDLVLEPFERLHTFAEYPGCGLGLAMCRRILESVGGEIRAESAIGNGTRVWFTLPREATANGGMAG